MTTNEIQGKPDIDSNEVGSKPDIKDSIGERIAGAWVVSGEDMPALSAIQETQGDYIISGGILGKQEKAITYAHPKHLKTMLEFWKGMCMATGTPFFDYQVKQGRVVYIGMEDTLPKLSNRFTKMKQHFPPLNDFVLTVLETGKRSVMQIESLIFELKPSAVIIDPLTNLLKKEDKKEDVEALLKQFDGLIERYSVSIILIHHARKGKGETLESMRGSSALTGWADTICRIERRDNSKDRIKLDFECRHAVYEVEQLKLNFRREDCCFEEDATLVDDLQKKIEYKLISVGGQVTLAELKVQLEDEASLRTIERAIKGMHQVRIELDPQDRRKRIVKLDSVKAISTRNLSS
jgi:hypothetical protein